MLRRRRQIIVRGSVRSRARRVWKDVLEAGLASIWTSEGWLYVAAVLDLYSHSIVPGGLLVTS
jgi:hypothetical protein